MQGRDGPRHVHARIGQNPSVPDQRTLRLRIEGVVFVERQHHIVEPKPLRTVDRHDLHLARLRHVTLLAGLEKRHEVPEAHTRLHRLLELRSGPQHVRETLLGEFAPRTLRILRQRGTQLAERADEALGRKTQRKHTREFGCVRNFLPILRPRKRRATEMLVGLSVARMIGKSQRVEKRQQGRRVENGALAFPDDTRKPALLQRRRQTLAKRVGADQHRGGNAARDRINRLQCVEHGFDEILRLRSRRLDRLHETVQFGLRRLVLRRLPAGELVLKPSVHEDRVDGRRDGRTIAPGLLERADLIGPARPLPREDADVTVAPAVDRLLAIADDKDGLLPVRLLGLLDESREGRPLLAARILELVQRPRPNLRVHPVLKRQPRVIPKSRDEPRHVREHQPPRVPHAFGVLRLEGPDERPDATRHLELRPDHVSVERRDRIPDRRRLRAAKGIGLAVEGEFDRRAREKPLAHLDKLLRKPLHARERSAEPAHPRDKLPPCIGIDDALKGVGSGLETGAPRHFPQPKI